MNFFRLRILNTLLCFLIGVILGYTIKERLNKQEGNRYIAVYPRVPAAARQPPDDGSAAMALKSPAAGGQAETVPHRAQDVTLPVKTDESGEDFAFPVNPPQAPPQTASGADYDITYAKSEFTTGAGRPVGGGAENKDNLVSGAEDAFFKNPQLYAGRDLKMELQMILAGKTQSGWRLNFVHARGGKSPDYAYIDDDSMLGEKPELKIGYFYNVVFKCVKGDLNSGNKLLGINPSGNKAAWATGVSAIE